MYEKASVNYINDIIIISYIDATLSNYGSNILDRLLLYTYTNKCQINLNKSIKLHVNVCCQVTPGEFMSKNS